MNSTNYFSGCTTISEAKIKFKNLCKVHHPDLGGDSKIMAEIIRQYDSFTPSNQKHTNRYRGYGGTSFNNMGSNSSYNPRESSFTGYTNFSCLSIPFDHPIHEELRKAKDEAFELRGENRILKSGILKRDQQISKLTKDLLEADEEIEELELQCKMKDTEIIRLVKEIQSLKKSKKSKSLCDIIKAYIGIDEKSP